MNSQRVEHRIHFPDNHVHELFMKRALELAALGSGRVSPNPLVGSVIVHEGKIIGEGWHKQYGGPHAEVNAIQSVTDKDILKECTLYVNLEPCTHEGKTPPCADLIIRHQLKEVVVANYDSNPLVAGKGIQKLRNAGITVIPEVLSSQGRDLNRRFFIYMENRRPAIILKWAQTADGFIARKNNDSRWISDLFSRQVVHKWRSEEDAVLVGPGTAWHDNPVLNVRNWSGRNPIRILIDRHLKTSPHHHLFDGTQHTICYNLIKDEAKSNLTFVQLSEQDFLTSLIQDLYSRRVQSLIVEGGAQILKAFIKAGLWDDARVFVSPQIFEDGIRAPEIKGRLIDEHVLNRDWLRIIRPAHASEKTISF